jgi:tetratricopeptide (TPR) repeat protein
VLGSSDLIDCETALARRRNKYSLWKKARDRLIDEVWPELNPSFRIQPGAKIFTIGSCFARNIEEYLHQLGFRIPTLDFKVPTEEYPARPNGILNKYTPAAIFQEIDWTRRIFQRGGEITESDSALFLYECTDGSCIDTNLGGFIPVSKDRFFERRRQVYETFKEVFSANHVVITLGLVEAWFDQEKGIYIQESPIRKDFAGSRGRFAFQALTYSHCNQFIQNTIDAIRHFNNETKFLITTSPVPLSRTFTDKDVIIANTYSKSVLRTVAGDIAASNPYVDYFPSYESVMLTKSWHVWLPDLMHVTDAFVGKIVARLTDKYCAGLKDANKLFVPSSIDSKDDPLPTALELARQAVEGSPQAADLRKHYAHLLAGNGDLNEAEQEYLQVIRLTPGDAEAHYRLSGVLARLGRLTEAIEAARLSTQLGPHHYSYHRHFGRLLIKGRNFGSAAIQYLLASVHRRSIMTTRPGLRRFLGFLLPWVERTRRNQPI